MCTAKIGAAVDREKGDEAHQRFLLSPTEQADVARRLRRAQGQVAAALAAALAAGLVLATGLLDGADAWAEILALAATLIASTATLWGIARLVGLTP